MRRRRGWSLPTSAAPASGAVVALSSASSAVSVPASVTAAAIADVRDLLITTTSVDDDPRDAVGDVRRHDLEVRPRSP